MFKLIHNYDIATSFIHEFDAAIKVDATVSDGWLSTPGGGFEARIYYRKDLDIWAYVDTNVYENRYSLWFGAGEPSWRPAIEINVPVMRTMHCYGQLAQDSDGSIHLLHKGGLGGGKYSVKPDVFSDLIDGFVRDDVLDGKYNKKYFIIGKVGDHVMQKRLASYVREATRIRKLREDNQSYNEAIYSSGGGYQNGQALGGEFKGESEKAGEYHINRLVAFQRIHGKIQRSLADALKANNIEPYNSRLTGGIGPDIFTKGTDGLMDAVYEIKVGSDSQAIFTAIGQLVVYSSGGNCDVRKYLVVNDLPKSSLFVSAIKKLNISVIRYTILNDVVSFYGL